ncbi:DUF885 family protein [Rhodohalobacter sp. 614A]|uniref:DUF885 family protein n=1 Tax=Rhodohalobacter sp. 614A TaxID=2908649 RepID=UPI001F3076E2|nr:DUF885 family protein [Rhodohalobacter sp. 614A]
MILPSQSFAFSDDESIENLIRIFDQDEDVLNRKYSVRHSDEYFNRFEKFYNDWQNRLDELNYEELSQPGKVDYHLLVSHINRRVYFLNRDKEQFENVKQWLPDLNGIMQYINTRRVGTKPDAQNLANEMNQWAIEVETLQSKLQESPMLLKKDANAAHDALEDIRNALEDAFLFYNGYDPDFTWWMEEPYRKLDEVLKTYSEFINEYFDAEKEQMDNSGIVGNPIGEEEILKRLEFEMISYTPEELIEIAEYQFAKSEEEMLKASRELGYGDDWHAALEHVKEAYVEPGRKPELIMRLYNESIDFIEDRDLITIPDLAKEVWRMQMMSPERQLINPFFTGGEVISISYPTNTMGHEQKMMSLRGNNPHFNRATVQHELIPGHHLQGFMNRRYNTYRYPFRTSFWGEGWALYWELLLWDLDFPKSPEDRIGMLFWRTHRYARIIFSLNYHLGNWTPQQCIDYLVERVGHEYANAEAEVRRSFTGNYGPLYQIAYMIGGMEIYSLYKDLVDTDQMSPIEFHDTILKGGSIPIRMVKALLTDEELEKNQTLNWNFADYIYDE